MRKHEVQCQIEGDKEHVLWRIKDEVNNVYAKAAGEILRKSNLSKEEQIYILEQMQKNFKNL